MGWKVDWRALRNEFPIADQYAYLNHAAHSPLPLAVARRMLEVLRYRQTRSVQMEDEEALQGEYRQAAAGLINASPEEIAFVHSTSEGLNIAAQGLPLAEGDEVLLCDMEFPSNVYPWLNLQRRGVAVRILPQRQGGLDRDLLAESVSGRTKVIAVSSVQFLTGHRTDLEAISAFCRQHGLILVVDAMQSLGVLSLDVRKTPIDILAAGASKWLLGPEGAGIFYARRELIEVMWPPFVGAISVAGYRDYLNYELTPRPGAARYEIGTPNLPGLAGLSAAIGLLLEHGVDQIEARVLPLTQRLIDGLRSLNVEILSNLDPRHRSSIVTFAVADAQEVHRRLTWEKIIISLRRDAEGRPYLRVSPHAYNSEEEIDRLLEALAESIG